MPDGGVTGQLMVVEVPRPLKVFVNHAGNPCLQLFFRAVGLESFYFLCFKVTVGHLQADPVEIFVAAVKISVAHGLGEMDLDGLLQP